MRWPVAIGVLGAIVSAAPAIAAFAIFMTAGSVVSDPTAGLLPADRSAWVNWTKAGLQSIGGIPNRTTQCGATLTPIGSGSDDSSAIQAAINACAVNDYVLLSVGTFTIAEGSSVAINRSITVRGSGACAGAAGVSPIVPASGGTGYPSTPSMTTCTLIRRSGGAVIGSSQGLSVSAHFLIGGTDGYGNVSLSAPTNLTSDAAAGASTISVASTTGFTVGTQVLLSEVASNLGWQTSWTWVGETQWSTPDYRDNWRAQNPTCQSGSRNCNGGSTPVTNPCIVSYSGSPNNCLNVTSEMKQIASIGSGTITFDSPIMISYRTAMTAQIQNVYGGASSSAPIVSMAGLENMTLQNADASSIMMAACAYCWAKNVESTIYFGYYNQGDIALEACFRCQIEGIYSHISANPTSGGHSYNWSIDRGSSENLIENSISTLADKVMVMRGAGGGSVIAYNYFDDSLLGDSTVGESEVGMNASHWWGTHHTLFEGNWSFQASSDPVWGGTPFQTFFRNDVTGFRTPFHDYHNNITINDAASIPGAGGGGSFDNGATGMAVALAEYWYSFIGNVIGTSGAMTGWSFHVQGGSNAIWVTGGSDGGDPGSDPEVWSQQGTAGACTDGSDQCPLLRLSNYDYVTNSLNDPSNPAVPNSFYTSVAPAFFASGSGYTWPWVNAQGSTKVQSGPTTTNCTANVSGPCSGLPAKARVDNGTPFVQP